MSMAAWSFWATRDLETVELDGVCLSLALEPSLLMRVSFEVVLPRMRESLLLAGFTFI